MRERGFFAVLLAAALLALGAGGSLVAAEELDDAQIFIEINDTDGDAGIQIMVDGEDWKKLQIFSPDGMKVLEIRGKGSIGEQGLTELAFESAEPSFIEQPLDEFLELFPEGIYLFEALTTEGEILEGEAELTHALPEGPVLVSPEDEEEDVDPDDAVLMWLSVPDPPGSAIVKYEVIVIDEEAELEFKADLPPTATSIRIPPEFMQPGTEYKWEILAREESGNQTISEAVFVTAE